MQQQQDRHQSILSQTKRLLSHHHHHHLSNAQHLQILSNLMKTLCKPFWLMKSHRQDKTRRTRERGRSRRIRWVKNKCLMHLSNHCCKQMKRRERS
jgi:hypothetical protein